MNRLKVCALLLLLLTTGLRADEVHEVFRRLASTPDGNAQRALVDGVAQQRLQLTSEIIAVLNQPKASIFSKIFALKMIEATRATGALEAALPYVGTIDSAIGGAQQTESSLIGARALAAIGAPASDRLLQLISGKETAEQVFGIAYVVRHVDGPQEGDRKLARIMADETRSEEARGCARKIRDALSQVIVKAPSAQ